MSQLSPEANARDVKVVAKGGTIQVLGQVTQGAVAFVFVAVAVRLLGTAEYGVFRQVAQILAVAAQIGIAGFNYSALRFIAKARVSGDPGGVRGSALVALKATLGVSTAVFISLQLGAEFLAARFAEDSGSRADLAGLIRLGAAFVPLFALTQVLRYCTQAYKTMVPSVVVGNIVQPLARLAAATALILAGFGVRGAVMALVIASAVSLITAVYLFRRMMTEEERNAPSAFEGRAMARFAFFQGGSSLLGVQTLGLGVLILGAFGTDRDVGLLGIALALQTPGTLFLGGVVNIWAPVVTDLYERGEIARLESLYRTITRWVLTFSLPVFAALILMPELFVELVAGGRGVGAAPLAAVLAAGNLFYTGTGPTGLVISMTGRPGVNLINSVVAVVLYVALGIWLVPKHGALGIVVVDAIVTVVINLVRVLEARLLVGIHPFGRSLLKPLGAIPPPMLLVLAVEPLVGDSNIGSFALLAAGGIFYVGNLLKLGLDPEERLVWESLGKRIRKSGT